MIPIKTDKVKITSSYGKRHYKYRGKIINDFHHGIDLIGGSDILAFEDGTVTSLVNEGKQYGTGCYVRIKHTGGYYTLYYHLKSGSICVKKGQKVIKGQKIGIMGATGKATGVHLHFQIDKGDSKSSINPYDYVFKNKTFPKPEKKDNTSSNPEKIDLLLMVKKTIRGDYGNGATRKRALGKYYDFVQYQVIQNVKRGTTNWNNIKLY